MVKWRNSGQSPAPTIHISICTHMLQLILLYLFFFWWGGALCLTTSLHTTVKLPQYTVSCDLLFYTLTHRKKKKKETCWEFLRISEMLVRDSSISTSNQTILPSWGCRNCSERLPWPSGGNEAWRGDTLQACQSLLSLRLTISQGELNEQGTVYFCMIDGCQQEQPRAEESPSKTLVHFDAENDPPTSHLAADLRPGPD